MAATEARHGELSADELSAPSGQSVTVGAKAMRPPGNRIAVSRSAASWRIAERFALPAGWLVVVVIFSVAEPGRYLTSANIANILGSQAVLLVLTLGLMIALTAGDYDLSVAAVLTLSSMTLAQLNVNSHVPILLAIAVVIVMGALVGAVNALVVLAFDIDPFIVTLGTSTVMTGVVYWTSHSLTVTGVDTRLTDWVVNYELLDVPLEFYYALVLCIVIWYVYRFTPLGQRLLFVGQSRDVARLSGLNVNRIRFGSLVLTSTIAALAGVLYAATEGGADPTSGQGFMLPAFAACFLGATSIKPGRFNPWGTLVAVYFLISGITGFQIAGAQNYVQQLFYGGALVIAVVLARLSRRRLR